MDIRQAITLIEAMSKFKPRLFAETPEFERWFSGSKVVDDSGKPLLCFHGTLENFDVFKLESERRRAHGFNRFGFWFDTDHMTPDYFASNRGSVMPVYLAIRNPMVFTSEPVWHGDQEVLDKHIETGNYSSFNRHVKAMDRRDSFDHLMQAAGIEQYHDGRKSPNTFRQEYEAKVEDFRNEAMSEGYDGFYLENTFADAGSRNGKLTNWWIAFKSEQIKSALTNSGKFSADDPSIQENRT